MREINYCPTCNAITNQYKRLVEWLKNLDPFEYLDPADLYGVIVNKIDGESDESREQSVN